MGYFFNSARQYALRRAKNAYFSGKKVMIWEKFPHIETERLNLRKLLPSDGEAFYKGLSHPVVSKNYGEQLYDWDEAQERLLWYREQWYLREGIWWSICPQGSLQMMGVCGFSSYLPAEGSAVLSYWLSAEYWHQGYATEAVSAILGFAAERMRVNRVLAYVKKGNSPSVKLLTKQGFCLEQTLNEWDTDKGRNKEVLAYVQRVQVMVS